MPAIFRPSTHRPERIVAGGQTGADRGGLEAAIALKIPHGGWCPRGRRAEDGRIPARFVLEETASNVYAVRTRWNVRDSDATVLFTRGAPSGGSALTAEIAGKMGRPLLHVDLAALDEAQAAKTLARWLATRRPAILNIAGSRESQAPGMAAAVKRVLTEALGGAGPLDGGAAMS
jgi:hypothetical protein